MVAQMHPAFESLPRTRQEILRFLKAEGPARADSIAERIGITLSGIRQHLTALEHDGLVLHGEFRDGPGRPKHVFTLAPAADELFPRNYAQLANELLDCLMEEGPELVARVMEKRATRRLERLENRFAGLTLGQKVDIVATMLDSDGYLVDVNQREDGSFVITERNCAVLGVARKHPRICSSELSFLRQALPEASVSRISYIMSGEHKCAYEVKPRL